MTNERSRSLAKSRTAHPSRPAQERLSDLESTVLGIVWRDGPCTRYLVRNQFRSSPSAHWRGSVGSIYPVVDRLEQRGLIRSTAQRTGQRKSRACTITPAGRRALVDWLGPPLPDDAAGVHFDAIRTRVFFLGALTPAKRRRFLDDAEVKLRASVEASRRYSAAMRAKGDTYGYLANSGALKIARARLAWIVELRRVLG